MQRTRLIGLLVAAVIVAGACGSAPEPSAVTFQVPTQPPPAGGVNACMDALATGTLVADARWGIALGPAEGPTIQIIWPAGFVGRQADGAIELLDGTGTVVGRVGDRVEIGGGLGAGDAWWACGAPTRPS